jgi:hypothetical protein
MEISAAKLLSLSAIVMACGCAGPHVTASHGERLSSATSEARASSRPTPPATIELEQGLQAGDYVVYRFSGSFRKASATPLTLTERVLGREGGILALEIVLDDGAKKQTLHIHKDSTPGAAREVFDVTRVEPGSERPATVEAYEAMMAKTVLAADQNEEQLGTETTNVQLGGKTLTCKKTSYRVRVGKHEATMSTVASDAFPWGDVAGDITTLEGQVLYRVEVVDAGTRTRERDGVVAVAR